MSESNVLWEEKINNQGMVLFRLLVLNCSGNLHKERGTFCISKVVEHTLIYLDDVLCLIKPIGCQ